MRCSPKAKAERRLKERVKSDVCASDPSAHSRQPTFPHKRKKKDRTLPCSSLEFRLVGGFNLPSLREPSYHCNLPISKHDMIYLNLEYECGRIRTAPTFAKPNNQLLSCSA